MNGRRIILTVAAALALVAGGTAAGAAIASGPVDSSGVVHGCYTTNAIKGSHFFVLQDAGTNCPRDTTAIMWNQQGRQGPQGSAGSQGPQGVAGPQGPAGTSGWSGQVQFTLKYGNNDIDSVEIVSQAGPSTLSVKPDPNNDDAIIFTGDNLPTKMFPIVIPAGNDTTGSSADLIYEGWDTVPNTSFEISIAGGLGGSTIHVFNYFLPSS
jgi:hypothetical protein